jgi:alcohol dehydrogenase class IV
MDEKECIMETKSSMSATLQTANLVLTGMNAIEKIGEASRHFGEKALIVTDSGVSTTGIVDRVREILEDSKITVDVFDQVEPEPDIQLVHRCAETIKAKDAKVLVGVGGGSPLDVTKGAAVAMTNPGTIEDYIGTGLVEKRGLPSILVPTTSGTGSEATKYAIFTVKNMKQGVIDPKIYADIAIVDPSLTVSMPPRITASTGMDALCHALECYTALSATPISDFIAEKGLALISRSLRKAVFNGQDYEARSDMALGSFYGGLCLTNASVTAVHALSFPLGADYHIPHGMANAIMLPYVIRYNCLANMERFRQIAILMGEKVEQLSLREGAFKAADAVETLMKDIGLPLKLRDLDISRQAIPSMAERALTVQRLLTMNPRFMGLHEITEIYEEAF